MKGKPPAAMWLRPAGVPMRPLDTEAIALMASITEAITS
jgi:hypothetical protein